MTIYPADYEVVPVTELHVGDTVRFHGARFQIHTTAMLPQNQEHQAQHGDLGPIMTALATWLEGEVVPGYFGPGKDWNFQGNKLHRVRRELAQQPTPSN